MYYGCVRFVRPGDSVFAWDGRGWDLGGWIDRRAEEGYARCRSYGVLLSAAVFNPGRTCLAV